MQKLELTQTLGQKLSPQQIQFIKLLQVPTAELDTRIEEELEVNPALEEGKEEEEVRMEDSSVDEFEDSLDKEEDLNLDDYLHDDFSGYKMYADGQHNPDDEDKEIPVTSQSTMQEQLLDQVGFLNLGDHQRKIAEQLVGSLESDGYLRRELDAIKYDLAFVGVETNVEEIEAVLQKVHGFDPAGIGARNLRECLLLQLKRKDLKDPDIERAIKIIKNSYDDFTKKHFEKIMRKAGLSSERELKKAIDIIVKLNPKPGANMAGSNRAQYLIPDFILHNDNGNLELTLNSKNAPELRVSRSYSEMMQTYDKSKKKDKKLRETVSFVKQKLDAAKWFIDAIRQRQQTLLNTMNAIVSYQYDFFLEGDESKLKPMILKDIANKINMDISTISRVANSKSIQTEFGIFPLKFFFSEGIATDSGVDVSSREVKYTLRKLIEDEEKTKPLSDDKLEKLLRAEGYNIARRTVAKYREQMNIPVARLRKELK